jgi:hypothetical protein
MAQPSTWRSSLMSKSSGGCSSRDRDQMEQIRENTAGVLVLFSYVPGPEDWQSAARGYEPGISIESLDAAKAIYRPIKYKFHDLNAEQEEDSKFSNVHILDLKTLTSVLTGEVYSFQAACDIFGAPASRQRKSYSHVTKPAIGRLLRDVTAELELLNRLTQEFERHPVDLVPDRCYSPATLAKSYFSEMGIKPPQEKFRIPNRINGIATQASAGGRAECMIRRTPVPVTYVDQALRRSESNREHGRCFLLTCFWRISSC